MGDFLRASLQDRPVHDRPVWSLGDDELLSALDEVFAAEQTLAARRLALIAEIDSRRLARQKGAGSTSAWLSHRLLLDSGPARRMVRLAHGLGKTVPETAQALAEGRVHVEQARVIHNAIADLPGEVGADLRAEAERTLVGYAAEFCPAALARLGERVLEHVAPEVAERHEQTRLKRGEARAWRDRAFTLSPDGPGRMRLSGCLDAESAATVSAAIEALCSPAGSAADDDRDPGQRRADALVQVCRTALAGGELPLRRGQRPQVMVMMPYQPWQDQTAEAMGRLADGQRVTPETLRRMACDADLIPVVLGGAGEVLDVGRAQRLFPAVIRRALIARDLGCAFPSCDRPASWCDAHHIVPWSQGGVTSLDNGALLCGQHHRLVHDGEWAVRLGADRLPEFIPPSYVDDSRTPRRNLFHRRA